MIRKLFEKRTRWGRRPGARSTSIGKPVELRLYTKPGCHLCDQMKAELEGAAVSLPFRIQEVDIESDGQLSELYGRSIPVLRIAGRTAFKGRLTRADFERKFERLAAEGLLVPSAEESS